MGKGELSRDPSDSHDLVVSQALSTDSGGFGQILVEFRHYLLSFILINVYPKSVGLSPLSKAIMPPVRLQ